MKNSAGDRERTSVSFWLDNFRDNLRANHRPNKQAHEAKTKLDLLYKVGRKVGTVPELTQLVERVTQMTQHALHASASSVLLLDEKGQELVFEVAEGKVAKTLKPMKFDTHSGIAGWVARHGKPLIVNDVTKDHRFNKNIDEITGFVTKNVLCVPLVAHRKIIGVLEVLNKLNGSYFTEQDLEMMISVASTAAISIENMRLHQTVLAAYKSTIKALAAAIDAKDPYTGGHSQRVMEYALLGGTSLSLSDEKLEDLEYAGILHDIGKIGIADSILTKPGPLSPDEWHIMREHPSIGANMLSDIPFLGEPRDFLLHHHERYDGKGYPDGLRGEDIPVGARLLAVADAFDTMTTDRSYRASLGINNAINELERFAGTQFCPVVVKAFISSFRKDRKTVRLAPG